jgi:S1-C subfamily serine protease
VENFSQLRRLIFAHKTGDKVKVKFRRGEEVKESEVTLGEMPRR